MIDFDKIKELAGKDTTDELKEYIDGLTAINGDKVKTFLDSESGQELVSGGQIGAIERRIQSAIKSRDEKWETEKVPEYKTKWELEKNPPKTEQDKRIQLMKEEQQKILDDLKSEKSLRIQGELKTYALSKVNGHPDILPFVMGKDETEIDANLTAFNAVIDSRISLIHEEYKKQGYRTPEKEQGKLKGKEALDVYDKSWG